MIVFFGVELGEPAGFGESATAWLRYGGYGLLVTRSDVTWSIDELNVFSLFGLERLWEVPSLAPLGYRLSTVRLD